MPHRRLSRFATAATTATATATVSITATTALALTGPVAAAAPAAPAAPPATAAPTGVADIAVGSPSTTAPIPLLSRSSDHLTITVSDSGKTAKDGTYELYCHPARGTHSDARGACDKLDSLTRWGKDLFAGVPKDSKCTMQYGGPATARVTGTWAGRTVNAQFKRTDGCEIGRWDRFVPVLPAVTS
ncbi:SSI family serine proteinase inhibitor [Streptomyces rimosus]|uniref:SSI family serine proteinase inhibitor n=1 Tax=Streptomyces rimosus TaxID=1927 RepID=UPI0004C87DA3|nr:SSI family serine proteinase inhibitor [Streptomyces rimosus]